MKKPGKKFKWRLAGRGGLAVIILFGLWFDWSLEQVTGAAPTYHLPDQADVIIVLGCGPTIPNEPSPCPTGRVEAALTLWRQGLAPYLIMSGGVDETGASEARFMYEVARQEGVPPNQIALEELSTNTIENLRNSKSLMQNRGWQSAILVSDAFHLYRARQQAKDLGLDVVGWWPALASPGWQNFDERSFGLVRDTLALMAYQSFGWIIYR